MSYPFIYSLNVGLTNRFVFESLETLDFARFFSVFFKLNCHTIISHIQKQIVCGFKTILTRPADSLAAPADSLFAPDLLSALYLPGLKLEPGCL